MKITVLHNISRDGGFGINEVPGPAGKTYQAGSHQLVKVFEFTADGMTPDRVFHAFNVGDDPAYSVSAAERELAGAYRARRLRALSVGDVLVFEASPAYQARRLPSLSVGDVPVFEVEPGGPVAESGYLACTSAGWKAVPCGDLAILGPGEAEAVIRERYGIGPREELTVTVPLVKSSDIDRAQLVIVPTPMLRAGDVILHHGMVIVIEGPARVSHGQCDHPLEWVPSGPRYHPPRDPEMVEGAECRIRYAWPGRVLNVEEVREAGTVPRSFLFDAERDQRGPGHGREDSWNVQGNVLATWAVVRGTKAGGRAEPENGNKQLKGQNHS
jgi:hypothetical protein